MRILGEDPVLCAAIRDLSIGMNGMNDILGVLMADPAENVHPGKIPNLSM
jgi:hypothetical protein